MATWLLDPATTHLNHGSFGATPIEVLAYQRDLRERMEANPVDFMVRQYQPLLESARSDLAAFVGADADGLVFVPNATYGVNSVLRSLESQLFTGAEIVITTHTYNACRNAAIETAQRVGGKVVVADVPFPIADPGIATAAILDVLSARTGLVLVDHVTSATGIVLPIAELAAQLPDDVLLLVDGAHAPGMIDVDIGSLGASFYTANCHKWICSPKGAAFLWVAPEHRETTRAVAVSHGYNDGWPTSNSRFHAQFDWTGTDDPTARLCVSTALTVLAAHHDEGWSGIRSSNHSLVLAGRQLIASALGTELPAPDHMIGSIASVLLPRDRPLVGALQLADVLHTNWSIELPVIAWPAEPHQMVRISAQQYNTIDDYRHLAKALGHELGP